MIRKLLVAAALAAAFGSVAVPASAAVVVNVAPPPLRSEVVPRARPGYVWVGGHWGWRNHKHRWIKGTWLRERRGFRYDQPAWVERDGRWQMVSGNWRRAERDRDGDGIPNRVDRDRDGDGVANRNDLRPDNPRRY